MKSIKQKREEAAKRAASYKWEDSKAFRTGSSTREQWDEDRQELIKRLTS